MFLSDNGMEECVQSAKRPKSKGIWKKQFFKAENYYDFYMKKQFFANSIC